MSAERGRRTLVLSVRLHDGRYHGVPEWPPSPARLFQALVAGAGLAGPLGAEDCAALRWLEGLPAPLIAAPQAAHGPGLTMYVPNNDLDAVGGDPGRTGKIRDAKHWRPWLLSANLPLHYAWALTREDAQEAPLGAVASLADRLYQLGRGVDLAWAWVDVLEEGGLAALLAAYAGEIHRPSLAGDGGAVLSTPHAGSLDSLAARHGAYGRRFTAGQARSGTLFSQPPRASFTRAHYGGSPPHRIFDVLDRMDPRQMKAWALVRVVAFTVAVRDRAIERLSRSLPDRVEVVEQALRGRRPDGTNAGPPGGRVRIVPLPSIGHEHADLAIRRVLVEVPASCPLRPDDVFWAFSGLEPCDPETGELLGRILALGGGDGTPGAHFGLSDSGGAAPPRTSLWRTVTPASLPRPAGAPRRADPGAREEGLAGSVMQALRHAELPAVRTMAVQREPFHGHGARAEDFASGTRFGADRLWHVELGFGTPVSGPIVIGDGRFLGLGVMAPVGAARQDGGGDR